MQKVFTPVKSTFTMSAMILISCSEVINLLKHYHYFPAEKSFYYPFRITLYQKDPIFRLQ